MNGNVGPENDRPLRGVMDGLFAVVIFLAVFGSWELLVRGFGISEVILPAPSSVLRALYAGVFVNSGNGPSLLLPTLVTLFEALTGLAVGAVIGLLLATLLSRSPTMERFVMPYIMALQSLPKIAIAPLLIVWFGFGLTSVIVLVSTSTFFAVLINAMEGFKSTDTERIDLMHAMGASNRQIFRLVVVPSALPFVFSGLQIALVISILSTIVGEFVNGQTGLGARILMSNNVLDTADVFAVLFILGALTAALDALLRFVRRKVLFWSPSERRPNHDNPR